MRKYPLKGMADEVESHGRFGDTELVHLNPVEVAGLAALSPTGKLTVNPVTGKKEAFLPLLIPIIASYGGSALAASAGASMVGAAIAGGAASGLATYAVTGDAERGLYSGIMGAGVGAAAGAAGTAARGVTDAGLQEGISAVALPGMGADTLLGEEAARIAAEKAAGEATVAAGMGNTGTLTGAAQGFPPTTPETGFSLAANPTQGAEAAAGKNMFMTGEGPIPIKDALQDPFMAPEGEGMISQMTKSKHLMPIAMGGSQLATLNAEADMEDEGKLSEEERKKKLAQAYADLQGAYGRAQPGVARGLSRHRSGMSGNTPPPFQPDGYATGGITRLNTYDADDFGGGGSSAIADLYEKYGIPYGSTNNGYGGIDPVSVQARLRGDHPEGGGHVATTPGYMAGMQPEFSYFQGDMENIQSPQMFSREQLNAPYNTAINRFAADTPPGTNTPYFQSNMTQPEIQPEEMAAGGQVPITMGGEQAMISGGGIAGVPTEYSQPQAAPEAGGQPSEQDITLLASALMGENPEFADQIVEAFVAQYGPEKFAEIRQQILQMIQGPNAQTEGMIQGQGGGMDDQVMGTIGSEQPVAVSPGEYIVPADVVSGLGDGSSDAGAAELDRMQQDVRMARGGGTTQPPAIDARKMMPA